MLLAKRIIQALCGVFCLAAAAVAAAAAPAAPRSRTRTTPASCATPRPTPRARAASRSRSTRAKFAASVHGELKLKCTDCHADVSADKLPHAEKLKPVNCATCHDKAVKEYAGTVHGKARKGGNTVAATCTDCHGTHDIQRVEGPDVAHESRERRGHLRDVPRQRRRRRQGQAARRQHRRQVPRQHPRQGARRARRRDRRRPAPTATARTTSAPRPTRTSRTSRAQHPGHLRQLPQAASARRTCKGMHGKLRQDGMLAAPGCTDCHSAHAIQQHDTPKFQTDGDQGVRHLPRRLHRDLPRHVPRPGDGARLRADGDLRVLPRRARGAAGVEPGVEGVDAEPAQDLPGSATPGASANFASFDPHANRHDKARDPLYYYAAHVHGAAAVRRVRVLRHPHDALALPRARARSSCASGKRDGRH